MVVLINKESCIGVNSSSVARTAVDRFGDRMQAIVTGMWLGDNEIAPADVSLFIDLMTRQMLLLKTNGGVEDPSTDPNEIELDPWFTQENEDVVWEYFTTERIRRLLTSGNVEEFEMENIYNYVDSSGHEYDDPLEWKGVEIFNGVEYEFVEYPNTY